MSEAESQRPITQFRMRGQTGSSGEGEAAVNITVEARDEEELIWAVYVLGQVFNVVAVPARELDAGHTRSMTVQVPGGEPELPDIL